MSKSTKGIEFVKIPVVEYHYLAVSEYKSRQVAEWLSKQKSIYADTSALRLLYSGELIEDVPEGK